MKALIGKWIFLSYDEHYKVGVVTAAVGEECILIKYRPFNGCVQAFSGLLGLDS